MFRKWFQQALGYREHRKSRRNRQLSSFGQYTRQMRIEPLEDRRMLSAATDIVFLFDESTSGSGVVPAWLSEVVVDLDAQLGSSADHRYGLVGYAENHVSNFAHTHLLDTDGDGQGDSQFGTASQLSVSTLEISTLALEYLVGGKEDGWDAIEHAVAEYEFRDAQKKVSGTVFGT